MKTFLKWSEIDDRVGQLAVMLHHCEEFRHVHAVCAIARGGLIVATMLTHRLYPHASLLPIGALNIRSYSGSRNTGEIQVYSDPPFKPDTQVLLIDDLVDHGATMQVAKSLYPYSLSAVLYAKPEGEPHVDLYTQRSNQDNWLVFPWEKDNG